MSVARGVIAGTLGLAMLQAVVSNQAATANVTGFVGFVSRGLGRWIDPSVPLIPDLRSPKQALADANGLISTLQMFGLPVPSKSIPGTTTNVPATTTAAAKTATAPVAV